MKKAKWNEVPPCMRKPRIQKAKEILTTIAMSIFSITAFAAVVILTFLCVMCYTY